SPATPTPAPAPPRPWPACEAADVADLPQPHQRPHLNDLPQHARERLAEMREHRFFTSDLSVNEFLLVKEAGFQPLGLVMGSSIYQIAPATPALPQDQPGCELEGMTRALYHARELAMGRMEEEAD